MTDSKKSHVTLEEYQAIMYYAVGVSSESKSQAHELAFCGRIGRDGAMHPVANSGYSIGTLQTDLGQRPETAKDLVQAYGRSAQPRR